MADQPTHHLLWRKLINGLSVASNMLHQASQLPVVFLAGPTAAGKTALAMNLFDKFDCELINVDAAQVYKGMDIGTAKINQQEQIDYPHQLIDIRDPWQVYSAADFCQDVIPLIQNAWQQNKLPVLVGGSMFYFHALEHGLSTLPAADENVRQEIQQYQLKHGQEGLHQWLAEIDPPLATQLKVADRQRVQRALEIFLLTKQAPSSIFAEDEANKYALKHRANIIKLAVCRSNRLSLHGLIEMRYKQMIEAGLVAEVEALFNNEKMQSPSLMSTKIVGYRQTWQYLAGEISLDESIQKGVAATRQLAKRQLTWLRNQSGMTWFIVDNQAQCAQALAYYVHARGHQFILQR